ncbi:MAG TPA: hypothetical protein VFC46_09085 [Humisphaera sp.]|nr:hypothetical protein [Humisphaera sp.]
MLSQRLKEYISACFTGIWLQSHEHPDALREIAQLCRDEKWALATWDVDKGLSVAGANGQAATAASATDPVAAIKSVNSLATPKGSALLVLPNFHRFMSSTEVIQALAHQVQSGKNNRTFVVILSPIVQIPAELDKLFTVIEHDLPGRKQLEIIAGGIATEKEEMPKGEDLQRLLDAASGLTRYEAEGAFSLSLVRNAKPQPETVWELKSQMLKKSGLLSLHRGTEKFADLGGLVLKQANVSRNLAS